MTSQLFCMGDISLTFIRTDSRVVRQKRPLASISRAESTITETPRSKNSGRDDHATKVRLFTIILRADKTRTIEAVILTSNAAQRCLKYFKTQT